MFNNRSHIAFLGELFKLSNLEIKFFWGANSNYGQGATAKSFMVM